MGVFPANVTSQHAAMARQQVGADNFVCTEQKICLTTNEDEARAAALACEADPNRPRPPTASDLTPNPDRHRPLTDPNRPRGHRPGLGRTRRAAESGETPQAEPSMGQGGEMLLASSCTGQGAQAEGGLSGGCWVSIRHGPCGLIVQCRIPEHLLMA